MAIDIARVSTIRDLDAFLAVPWQIYRGNAAWVPPLVDNQRALLGGKEHPFHRHGALELFLARSDGRPAGRVAAIENGQHNSFHEERTGFFGFFECSTDPDVAHALLDAAQSWLRGRGLTCMRGPASPSTNEECGLLVEGYEHAPVFLMPYNPPYYASLLEGWGLKRAKDLYAYYIDKKGQEHAQRFVKVRRVSERVRRRGDLVVRRPEMRRFHQEAAAIKEIYRRAWSGNWGFVPMTNAEFDHFAAELRQLIVPELARIIEVDNTPAAFGILLPNYNEAIRHTNGRFWPFGVPLILAYYHLRKIRGLRLAALGVVEEHRKAGLEAVLMHDLYQEMMESHYQWFELGWTLEDNHLINNAIEAWGGRLYKRYRMYEKAI